MYCGTETTIPEAASTGKEVILYFVSGFKIQIYFGLCGDCIHPCLSFGFGPPMIIKPLDIFFSVELKEFKEKAVLLNPNSKNETCFAFQPKLVI